MWVYFIKKYQKVWKNRNKVGVAKEICEENDIVLSKIGQGCQPKKSIVLVGLVDEWV